MKTILGQLIRQRDSKKAIAFFSFASTAREILEWAAIERTNDKPGAAQRLKNNAHIKTIQAFIHASEENIIPTAVTLAVKPGAYEVEEFEVEGCSLPERVTLAQLNIKPFKDNNKPALIIDGQHRILALAELPEQPTLLVCAMLGADDLERALHFVVINNKTKRVPADLVKAIFAELTNQQRESLRKRLSKVGITLGNYEVALDVLNSEKFSPFAGLLDWDINRKGTRRIKPNALEASLRAIVADLHTNEEIDVDDAIQILAAMWRGVRDSWNVKTVKWIAANSKDVGKHSKLVDKAGLVAVTEFLVERLNLMSEEGLDATDVVAVEEYSAKVMGNIPSRFWLMEWNEKQLDTSVGRGLIRQSLSSIRSAVASKADDPLREAVLIS
jgi:DGQHR domain-containing protein